jgi:hypothetical protein
MPAETIVRRWWADAGRVDLGTDQLDIDRRVRSPALPLRPLPLHPRPPHGRRALDCSSVTVRHTYHLDGTSRRRIVPVAPDLVPPPRSGHAALR